MFIQVDITCQVSQISPIQLQLPTATKCVSKKLRKYFCISLHHSLYTENMSLLFLFSPFQYLLNQNSLKGIVF